MKHGASGCCLPAESWAALFFQHWCAIICIEYFQTGEPTKTSVSRGSPGAAAPKQDWLPTQTSTLPEVQLIPYDRPPWIPLLVRPGLSLYITLLFSARPGPPLKQKHFSQCQLSSENNILWGYRLPPRRQGQRQGFSFAFGSGSVVYYTNIKFWLRMLSCRNFTIRKCVSVLYIKQTFVKHLFIYCLSMLLQLFRLQIYLNLVLLWKDFSALPPLLSRSPMSWARFSWYSRGKDTETFLKWQSKWKVEMEYKQGLLGPEFTFILTVLQTSCLFHLK